MRPRWSAGAIADLVEIRRYIGEDNPTAAREVADRIKRAVQFLGDQPQLGRSGRRAGTRELVVSGTPYIVAYAVLGGNAVEILAVMHGTEMAGKLLGRPLFGGDHPIRHPGESRDPPFHIR